MDEDIYQLHAEMCKVFSNPVRLKLLDLLKDGKEHSVGELQKRSGLGQANVSQHLSLMKQRGVVLSKREGRQILYCLSNPRIIEAFDIIRSILSERMAARERVLREKR
ncbi:MAG: metalloregulator ArsR/SmtB family transcription factor [Candidatus Micrarchaeota archaeon]